MIVLGLYFFFQSDILVYIAGYSWLYSSWMNQEISQLFNTTPGPVGPEFRRDPCHQRRLASVLTSSRSWTTAFHKFYSIVAA